MFTIATGSFLTRLCANRCCFLSLHVQVNGIYRTLHLCSHPKDDHIEASIILFEAMVAFRHDCIAELVRLLLQC